MKACLSTLRHRIASHSIAWHGKHVEIIARLSPMKILSPFLTGFVDQSIKRTLSARSTWTFPRVQFSKGLIQTFTVLTEAGVLRFYKFENRMFGRQKGPDGWIPAFHFPGKGLGLGFSLCCRALPSPPSSDAKRPADGVESRLCRYLRRLRSLLSCLARLADLILSLFT